MEEKDYIKAKETFENYIKNYDINDGMIRLKVIHTFCVVDIANKIAQDLNLNNDDIVLAKIIALLHDIGRFEQIKRYHTFNDGKSINHALLGVEILKENNFINEFVRDKSYHKVILKAIYNHNLYKLEDDLSDKELLHTKIVRDADKTDIYRVRSFDPMIDVVGYSEEIMNNSLISEDIYKEFMNNKVILSSLRKTPLDIWVASTALIYDFNYKTGLKIIVDKGYIDITINRISPKDENTKNQLEEIRKHAKEYINSQISNNT